MTQNDTAAPSLVSVVIPCYNQARFLADAVRSAVLQPHRPLEVIVVDDGSQEDLAPALVPFPCVRYLRQANGGVAAARNAGFAASGGKYVLFLDSDDRLTAEGVTAQFRVLEQNLSALAAVGLCSIIGAQGEPRPFRQQTPVAGDVYCALLGGNFIWMPAQVLYRRSAFAASGGFDSSVNACADYDLYLRLARTGPIACHRTVVAEYRQHGENMSGNARMMLRAALIVLERQSSWVRGNREYCAAQARGRRFWREFYGELIVEDVRERLRAPGRRAGVLPALFTLLRYHPVGVLDNLRRKAAALLRVARHTRHGE